jgi:hypothetical protein
MVTKDDISLAIEYIFQNCQDLRYPRGLYHAERCGCLEGHLNAFKKHPKDFVMMAKKKMARVI